MLLRRSPGLGGVAKQSEVVKMYDFGKVREAIGEFLSFRAQGQR